jgi:hypothetical protein
MVSYPEENAPDEWLHCMCYAEDPRSYWTLVIPYAGEKKTIWHPTEASGPFSTITRGNFPTKAAAREWAKENLILREGDKVIGFPYTLKQFPNAKYAAPPFDAEILKAAVSKYWHSAP